MTTHCNCVFIHFVYDIRVSEIDSESLVKLFLFNLISLLFIRKSHVRICADRLVSGMWIGEQEEKSAGPRPCNPPPTGRDQLTTIQVGVHLGSWRCPFIGSLIRLNKWPETGVKPYNSKENIAAAVDVKDKSLITIINSSPEAEN